MIEGSPPRYRVTTLGCRVNQYESESIAAALRLNGWSHAEKPHHPDLFIINTCTVTAKAAMQSRQAVRHAIREFPRAAILVTGCYAQSEPEVFAEIAGVDFIVGNADKHRIPEIVARRPSERTARPQIICHPVNKLRKFEPTPLPATHCRARPYLKIQDGCEDFCTYCIVPYTRGPSRSLPPDIVMERISRLSAGGAREAVLTGIHLGRYGRELSPQTSLYGLLQRIDAADAIDRIRLSSIEPAELSGEIIQMAAANRRIRPHFHIPLQSGDKAILEKMKRPYTPEFFKALVVSIRENLADAAVGVDVLVGFPGEDEQAFARTFSFLESLPITYLHVFPFSPRRKTPASRYPDQVAPKTIKERCARLRRLGQSKKTEFYQKQTGRTVEVILEDKREPSSGRLKGVSANYLNVFTDGSNRYKNKRVKCRLTGPVLPHAIVGKIVE
ncbi:MAG: tRNA (N(6)-L-threonylcarbamoyladenosine(37)-C(2))-methylthiotransferase MtaB [Desulfobacterales bacterium]|nr:tRNA (N(6)-L-threonylcarbamoyladenosine(37)-C(2))-methylthiotransferase MtaB [Desulfobacterales bacterium]